MADSTGQCRHTFAELHIRAVCTPPAYHRGGKAHTRAWQLLFGVKGVRAEQRSRMHSQQLISPERRLSPLWTCFIFCLYGMNVLNACFILVCRPYSLHMQRLFQVSSACPPSPVWCSYLMCRAVRTLSSLVADPVKSFPGWLRAWEWQARDSALFWWTHVECLSISRKEGI